MNAACIVVVQYILGIPETNFSGRKTLTALSVLRSKFPVEEEAKRVINLEKQNRVFTHCATHTHNMLSASNPASLPLSSSSKIECTTHYMYTVYRIYNDKQMAYALHLYTLFFFFFDLMCMFSH